jgi:hypothetical protein
MEHSLTLQKRSQTSTLKTTCRSKNLSRGAGLAVAADSEAAEDSAGADTVEAEAAMAAEAEEKNPTKTWAAQKTICSGFSFEKKTREKKGKCCAFSLEKSPGKRGNFAKQNCIANQFEQR